MGGTVAYMGTSGADNKYLHMALVHCDHEVESLGDLYVNGENIPLAAGGEGVLRTTTDSRYAGNLYIADHFGGPGQTAADTTLDAAVGQIYSTDAFKGMAYTYIRMELKQPTDDDNTKNAFSSGVPQFQRIVQGMKVYDPREVAHDPADSTTWEYSSNWALCVAHFLQSDFGYGRYGLTYSEINETELIASASDAGTPIDEYWGNWQSSTALERAGYSRTVGTTVLHSQNAGTTGSVAPTIPASPSIGDVIIDNDITWHVQALNSLTVNRYQLDGIVDSMEDPIEVLRKMKTAGAGVVEFIGGEWIVRSGRYIAPTVTINEADFSGGISGTSKDDRTNAVNTVRGVVVDKHDGYNVLDAPSITNSAYITEDGGIESVKEMELLFTNSHKTAQRLFKLELNKSRQSITHSATFTSKAMQLQVGDTFNLNFARYGYVNKIFTVWSHQLVVNNGALEVAMEFREAATNQYDWDHTTEETALDPAPNTTLPSAFEVVAPTNLATVSGTAQLVNRGGNVFSRMRLSWDNAVDSNVIANEVIWRKREYRSINNISQTNPAVVTTATAHEFVDGDVITMWGVVGMTEVIGIPYTVANATSTTLELSGIDATTGYTAYSAGSDWIELDWENSTYLPTPTNSMILPDVEDGAGYDFKVRSVNTISKSDWAALDNQVVVGKTAAPADPVAPTVSAVANGVSVQFGEHPDLDFLQYQIWVQESSTAPTHTGTGAFSPAPTTTTSDRSKTITGLDPDLTYYVFTAAKDSSRLLSEIVATTPATISPLSVSADSSLGALAIEDTVNLATTSNGGVTGVLPVANTVADANTINANDGLAALDGTASTKLGTIANGATDNGATIDTSGNINAQINLNTNGAVSVGKTSATSTTSGFWLGTDGASNYDFHIGNSAKSLKWEGSSGNLDIEGATLEVGTADQKVTINSNQVQLGDNFLLDYDSSGSKHRMLMSTSTLTPGSSIPSAANFTEITNAGINHFKYTGPSLQFKTEISGSTISLLDISNSRIVLSNESLRYYEGTAPSDTLRWTIEDSSVGATNAKIDGGLEVTGAFIDSSSGLGTSGQVLSSTGSATQWINAPSGGQSAAEILTAIKTVDGSGSGLDADLLDGKSHENFGATLATYGTTAGTSGRIRCTAPFNTNSGHMFQVTVSVYASYVIHNYVVGGYMYSSTNQWYSPTCVSSSSSSSASAPDIVVGRDSNGKAYISIANGNYTGVRVHSMTMGYHTSLADTYDPWTITIDSAYENSVTPVISKTWHSTNDGAGSGLDADLLDGQQGSYYYSSANPPPLTADPTLTLAGDATGSATFTNLGNATLTVAVVDDSHNHVWGNIDGASVNSWGGLRNSTASGYIEFGPGNTSWAHIYTDRPAFYLNKGANFQGNISATGNATLGGNLAFSTSGSDILGGVNTGTLAISAGAASANGGGIVLYGGSHATVANDIKFRGGLTTQLYYDDSASSWNFQANDVVTTGNVGIGTTAPGASLHVKTADQISGAWEGNGLLVTDTTTANSGLAAYSRSDGEHYFGSLTDSAASYLILGARLSSSANKVDAVVIRGSGNVGIGTTAPSRNQYGSIDPKLHVNTAGTSGAYDLVARFQAGPDDNNSGAAILINHTNDRGLLIEAGREISDTGIAHFGILNSGATKERILTLKQGGNVGIGQQSPSYKLDVSGTGRFTSTVTASNLSGTNTGDQSAASILTAIKTVDGAGSGLDADLLDGINSTGFAKAQDRVVSDCNHANFRVPGMYGFNGNPTNGTGESYGAMIVARNIDTGLQIAGGYTNDDLYFRGWGASGGTYTSWRKVWHAGNDGSGSGLDADLLDGLQASQFLRTDSANSTATQRIIFSACTTLNYDTIATANGSQGGLEIQNSGAGNDAFMTFHAGNDFALYFGLDADTNDISVGGWSMGANKYRIWHAGNDGSGSGLDADLLKGLASTTSNIVNTIPVRDGSGDIHARLLRQQYTGTTTSANYIMTQVSLGTGDNYLRACPMSSFRTTLYAGGIHVPGGGNIADNEAFGSGALQSNTSGGRNVAIGRNALYANTTAYDNTAVGWQALRYNNGYYNSALGRESLRNNTTGQQNTAVGYTALYTNTSASYNTATGHESLRYNITGSSNTATGRTALRNNTTGGSNTALGMSALYSNINGTQNTATGYTALYTNTSGGYNTANGVEALRYNTTGDLNTASGYRSLTTNTTGHSNAAYGVRSLNSNTTGHSNVANGYGALYTNTTGYYNVANGFNALYLNLSGYRNVATGYKALYSNTTATNNTATGYESLLTNTTGANNTGIGRSALTSNTTGGNNTALGYVALSENITGASNTASGYAALWLNTYGAQNTATGREALRSNTTAHNNTATGYLSLFANTTGASNTAMGVSSLRTNTTGIDNAAHGVNSLYYNTTGRYNTAIGSHSLFNNITGSGNIGIGGFTSGASLSPVFNPTTHNNRLCMGSTGVTNAYVQVAWTVVSDARDKTDFAPVPHGLDFVSQLKPTTYRYKMNREDTEGHGPLRYGFKAQEVLELEGADPVIVDAEDEDKLRFNDQSMIAVLVNALQELNDKFDAYVLTHP